MGIPVLCSSVSHTENKGSALPSLSEMGQVTSAKGLKPPDGKCH